MQVAFEAMGYIAVITNFGLIALLPSVKQYSRGYSDAQVILFFVVVEVSLWIRTTVFRGNFFPNSTGSSGLRDCQTPESCETSFFPTKFVATKQSSLEPDGLQDPGYVTRTGVQCTRPN